MEHQQRNRRPSRHAPLGVAHRQHSRERASWWCRQCRSGGDAVAGFCQAECSTGAADAPGAHERCTFWADLHLALPFPQVALFKGANLPKPVHASHPRPTRTSPTPHTHPPTPRPQMPNRTKNRQIYLPLPYFPRSLSPKTQICRFFVPSPPNSTDGAECARHLMGCS